MSGSCLPRPIATGYQLGLALSVLHPENRQAFHDCQGVRKRVKAADLNVPAKGLQVDIAHSTNRAAAAGSEAVQESFAFLLFIELLLNRRKYPGINPFDLALRVPRHGILQGRSRSMNRFNRLGNHAPLLGQFMPKPGANFGQRPLFVLKRQDVPAGGDAIIEAVKFALQGPRSTAFEQFRMNGTSEQVQAEFGNFGADEEHGSRSGKRSNRYQGGNSVRAPCEFCMTSLQVKPDQLSS